MKFLRLLQIVGLLFYLNNSLAQWNDRYWITGYDFWDSSSDFGATYFDFFEEPVRIFYNPDQSLDMKECSMIGSTGDGELLFYSNCMSFRAADHSHVQDGDTIAWSEFWTKWLYDKGETIGFPLPQGGITLQLSEDVFGLFYSTADIQIPGSGPTATSALYFARIGFSVDGQIEILEKDVTLISDTLSTGKITSCRHANGRDWWLLIPEYRSNKYYSIYASSDNMRIDTFRIGNAPSPNAGIGQAWFTADGSKYVRYDGFDFTSTGGRIIVYDFDRCTGLLLNEQWWNIPCYGVLGIAISTSGRFLYSTDAYYLWQYDLTSIDIEGSRITLAEWDGYYEPNWYETYFGMMAPAPDGRIYIIPPTGGSMVMHVIDRPNERGTDCKVLQHHIKLPTWNARTLPNYPNFRLGPVDGSSCDTLGIDNLPVARFRHEPEENEAATIRFTDLSYFSPKSWAWNFGDGTEALGPDQIHTYSQPGTYTVCLIVENAFASDMSCQEVYVEKVSSAGQLSSATLSPYPNPFFDVINISPEQQEILGIQLTDVHGKSVLDVSMTCPCSISLDHLPTGVYVYHIKRLNGNVEIGKVVKA